MASIDLAPKPDTSEPKEYGLFWNKNDKGTLSVAYENICKWLMGQGYYKFGNEFVQIKDNIVSVIESDKIKKVFLMAVDEGKRNFFFDKVAKMFTIGQGIWVYIDDLPDKFISDDENSTWFFFLNTAVQINKHHKIVTIPYSLLDGYIWDSCMVKRDFHLADFTGSDADRFARILGGKNYHALCKVLGYALSRYKDPTFLPAIVLNEDIVASSEGQSQGRSGKGLLVKFIEQFRNVLPIDGKSFDPKKTHEFQNVNLSTNIIAIEDLPPKFPLTSLFSKLTESFKVEPKNVRAIIIPFAQSPKMIFTSNFMVGGSDDSSLDRKLVFSVVKHFTHSHKPIHEFGRKFFFDWDASEWLKFDNFMCHCALQFLQDTDHNAIGTVSDNSKERQLIADTHPEFIYLMDSIYANNFIDFAPAGLNASGSFDYERWQKNMCQVEPVESLKLYIDKDKLCDKTVHRTKLNKLTATRCGVWLKQWADMRGVTLLMGADVLVADFKRQGKVEDLPF